MPSKTVNEILSTRSSKDLMWTSFNLFQAFPISCKNTPGQLYFYEFIDAAQALVALKKYIPLILFLGTIKRARTDCSMSWWFAINSKVSWLFLLLPVGVSASSAISKEKTCTGKDATYHLDIHKSTYLWNAVCVCKHWFKAIIHAYVIQNTHCYLFVAFIC